MHTNISRNHIFAIIIVFTLIVVPMRIIELKTYPPMIVDEPANVRDIQLLLSPHPPAFFDFEWDFTMAMLVHYPSVALIKLGIVDPYIAIRVTSVLLSILALIPFFFLVKKETDVDTALITSLLLSTNFFFLQFSRVGWTNMLSVTLGLYALWCMTIAIHRMSYLWTSISGCVVGLTLYTYRAGEVYICGVLLLWFLSFIRSTKRTHIVALFCLCIFFALLVAGPWLKQIITHTDQFTLRQRVVSVWNAPLPYHGLTEKNDIITHQIVTTMKAWILFIPEVNPDIEANRYIPLPHPILAYPLIPIFWVGLVSLICKSKTWIAWIGMYAVGLYFGQIITVNPPNGSRGLILLPIMYICIAFGILQLRLWIQKFFPSNKVLFYLFVISVIILDISTYAQWMTWIRV